MKSVDPKKYDANYFETVLRSVDYTKPVTAKDFKASHKHIASMIKLRPQDYVVDYGCGNGDLAFLLAIKYGCKVHGIDYSKDAIAIALKSRALLEKSKSLQKNRVSFEVASISGTKKIKNVTAIYLGDVIEHLYDEEIAKMFSIFESWDTKNLHVVIHTDNDNYLKFVRPLIDALTIITGKSSLKTIKERNAWERERHVNLTTPQRLKKSLAQYGYIPTTCTYSPLEISKIQAQLGPLGSNGFITNSVLFAGRILSFLLPSFYIVFKKTS